MKTELYRTNTKSQAGPCSSIFSFDNNYCCACSKASISINKYIQKAGEPKDDAGFLKHIASYTAVVIHTPLSLDYSGYSFLGCTYMVSLSGC